MPIQARSVVLLFQVPFLTFQRLGLGLGPDSDLGLDKSTDQTKIEFFFMASLHKFFLQFIHSHTFRSSLSSANQLPEVIPVQPVQQQILRKGFGSRTKNERASKF